MADSETKAAGQEAPPPEDNRAAQAKITSVKVDLEYPFEHDGRTVDALIFRRMRAGDALAGENETNEIRAGYALYAVLAGVDIAAIEKLDLADLETITDRIAPMLGKHGAAAVKAARRKATA